MKTAKLASVVMLVSALFLCGMAFAQTDPGVRGGVAGAGQPLASVAANNPTTILDFFNDGLDRFNEVDSVSGTIEEGFGLCQRFNSINCASFLDQIVVVGRFPGTLTT